MTESCSPVSTTPRLWYRFCRLLFRIYFRFYHRGRILHAGRLPDTGGVILAGNHVSFLDPPFFGLCADREVYYLARDTLFRNPISGWILRSWNSVPVSRERGDLAAMRTVLRLLGEGKAVLMFPEGTRSPDGELQPARLGIGMIAAKAAVPVVPMRIFGTNLALPRGKSMPRPAQVTVIFGQAFQPKEVVETGETSERGAAEGAAKRVGGESGKAFYQAMGDEVMRRIAELKP